MSFKFKVMMFLDICKIIFDYSFIEWAIIRFAIGRYSFDIFIIKTLPQRSTKIFHKVTQRKIVMEIENTFKKVLDCAFKVHTELGPGLLESAYEECLYYELLKLGIKVEKQKPLPLVYK